MPLETRYLHTGQVIQLTHHFLEEKKQAGIFTGYEICSQGGEDVPAFGHSAVTAVARRLDGQAPVAFACDGQPEDIDRKEEKESWKFSDIAFAAMREWVEYRKKQAEPKESELKPDDLNFDFHISLRKGNHWTVYVFKFRDAQQDIFFDELSLLRSVIIIALNINHL